VCPAALPLNFNEGSMVRGFGLDVHRDFCEVAIAENGEVRSAGRVATRLPALELFAGSLVEDDVVALEATSGTDRIVSVLQEHGIQVVVANTRKLRAITDAKAKTDRLDARKLAKLPVSGLLDEVWTPWPPSMISDGSPRPGSSLAISGWTHGSASPGTTQLVMGGSQRPAPRRPGTCSARRCGRSR
jgi:hypothetical protein